jgi:hypothetical protein
MDDGAMLDPPATPSVGAIEVPPERVRVRRGRRAVFVAVAASVVVLGGGWLLAARHDARSRSEQIDRLTASAERLVALTRRGLPESWSIERVLEHITLRPVAQADGGLRDQRGQALVDVDAQVRALWSEGDRAGAVAPELAGWAEWNARPTYRSRAEVAALATALRGLDHAIAWQRSHHGLAARPLALDGEPLAPLPERIALPLPPVGPDIAHVDMWPLEPAVVIVLGVDTTEGCVAGARCRRFFAAWVGWDGRVLDRVEIAAAPADTVNAAVSAGPDAAVYTVAQPARGDTVITRYEPGIARVESRVRLAGDLMQVTTATAGLVITAIERDRAGSVRTRGHVVRGGALDTASETLELDELDLLSTRLEPRTGGPYEDGFRIERHDGVVIASREVTADSAGGGATVRELARIADFSEGREELFRQIATGPDGRTALLFDAGPGKLTLLLSADGVTWTGAPPAASGAEPRPQ